MSETQIKTNILPVPTPVEFLPSPEKMEQVHDYLTAVGKTENHAITFGLMATDHGTYSRRDLQKLFMAAQGDVPVWTVAANVNFEYSKDTFAAAGLTATRTEQRNLVNRKQPVDVLVTEVIVSQVDTELALAVSGAMLDWSLDHDNSDMRTVVGEARNQGEGVSSPIARYKILRALLENIELSEAEIATITGIDKVQANKLLNNFNAADIVTKELATDWDKRTFKLTGDGFKHVAMKRPDVLPETRALYDAADILIAGGAQSVQADDLYLLACRTNPELDKERLRQSIAQALVGPHLYTQGGKVKMTSNIPALESDGTFNGGYKTKYRLNDDTRESIRDFVQAIELLESGDKDVIKLYADRCREIVDNPVLVRQLVKKAAIASPQKNIFSDNEIASSVEKVIFEAGPMSVASLATELVKAGLPISRRGLQEKLNHLSEEGKLQAEQRNKDAYRGQMIRYIIGVTSKD